MKLARRIARLEAQVATVRVGPGVSGLVKALEADSSPAWTPTTGWSRRFLSDIARDKGWDETLLEKSLHDALLRLHDAGLLAEQSYDDKSEVEFGGISRQLPSVRSYEP
jgi:hypothetical protein